MKQAIGEREHMCSAEPPQVNKVNTYTQSEIGGNGCRHPIVLPGCQKPGARCLSFMASAWNQRLLRLSPPIWYPSSATHEGRARTDKCITEWIFLHQGTVHYQASIERHVNGLFEKLNDGWLQAEGWATCSAVIHSQDSWREGAALQSHWGNQISVTGSLQTAATWYQAGTICVCTQRETNMDGLCCSKFPVKINV